MMTTNRIPRSTTHPLGNVNAKREGRQSQMLWWIDCGPSNSAQELSADSAFRASTAPSKSLFSFNARSNDSRACRLSPALA